MRSPSLVSGDSALPRAAAEDTTWSVPAIVAALGRSGLRAVVRLIYEPGYRGTDDSFSHAAIVESLRAGNGWGINPGEPVNLSTSPLFTLLMLGLSWLGAGGT